MGYSIDPISADCYEGTTYIIGTFIFNSGIAAKIQQCQVIIETGFVFPVIIKEKSPSVIQKTDDILI